MVGHKRQIKFPFAGSCGASRCACLPVATGDGMAVANNGYVLRWDCAWFRLRRA
jgi:hypothetical protein